MQADIWIQYVFWKNQPVYPKMLENARYPEVETNNLEEPHLEQEGAHIKSKSSRYEKENGGNDGEIDQVGDVAMQWGIDRAENHAGNERDQKEHHHVDFHPVDRGASALPQ